MPWIKPRARPDFFLSSHGRNQGGVFGREAKQAGNQQQRADPSTPESKITGSQETGLGPEELQLWRSAGSTGVHQ
jgi:hypothetical protein